MGLNSANAEVRTNVRLGNVTIRPNIGKNSVSLAALRLRRFALANDVNLSHLTYC